MKQALEALKNSHPYSNSDKDLDAHSNAMSALYTAIAEASMQRLTDVQQEMEQEPVAWTTMPHTDDWLFVSGAMKPSLPGDWHPLYTHPRREWRGLTDEEIFKCVGLEKLDALRYLEAKLKEKNS